MKMKKKILIDRLLNIFYLLKTRDFDEDVTLSESIEQLDDVIQDLEEE